MPLGKTHKCLYDTIDTIVSMTILTSLCQPSAQEERDGGTWSGAGNSLVCVLDGAAITHMEDGIPNQRLCRVYTSVFSIWEESVLNEYMIDLKRFSKAKHSVGEDKLSREDSKYLSRLLP